MLFPTKRIADLCRSFIQSRSEFQPRLVHLFVCPGASASSACADLHIVLFPSSAFSVAKEFWQHTGFGVSSRLAEHCLHLMESEASNISLSKPASGPPSPTTRSPFKALNRHYGSTVKGSPKTNAPPPTIVPELEILSSDHSNYLEERYGRNMPLSYGPSAKRALRRRIARVLIHDPDASLEGSPRIDADQNILAGQKDAAVGPSARGVTAVTEEDVFLYPTGMSAIWSAHDLIRSVRPDGKTVCFGYVPV